MNWKNAFFVAVVAFIATLSWAIKLNNEKPVTALNGNEVSMDEMANSRSHLTAMENLKTLVNDNCGNLGSDYGIRSADSSKCLINAYSLFLDSLMLHHPPADFPFPSLPSNFNDCLSPDAAKPYFLHGVGQVIQSFRIDSPCELITMLNNASNLDSIYAYIAIQEQPGAGCRNPSHVDVMLDLIFKAKSNPVPGKALDAGYYYYDFTSPCPPMCDASQCPQLPRIQVENGNFCQDQQ